MKQHEFDEEKIRYGQDKREKDTKIRQLNEDRRRESQEWDDNFR